MTTPASLCAACLTPLRYTLARVTDRGSLELGCVTTAIRIPVNHEGFELVENLDLQGLWITAVAESHGCGSTTSEGRPHANENRPSGSPDATNEGSAVASMPTPARPDDPVPLTECVTELAGHLHAMSTADGCPKPGCGNVEPPRSAVPLEVGHLAAYLCSDCGCAWTQTVED